MKTISLAAAGLVFLSVRLLAETYVVDTGHASASDGNPGTLNLPWKTIQHGVDTAAPGDTVLIRGGVYSELVRTVRSGNQVSGPIVFSAYPGEAPVLDGTGVEGSDNGLIVRHDWIAIQGLEIRNWSGTGVWIEGASFFEMSDCEVHHAAYGIGIADGSHDFEFNRVEVHHFLLYGFDASPSGGADCYNGTFNDCVAHTGTDEEQNVDGFALGHGTQHGFEFNRCTTYDVYDGFDISSRETVLSRCLARDCWNTGYKLWQDEISLVNCVGHDCSVAQVMLAWDGQPGTVEMTNCTFMNAEVYTVWVGNGGDALHLYNSILAGGDNIGLAFEERNSAKYRGDYNLFQNDNSSRAIAVGYSDEFSLSDIAAGDWTAYSGQDSHSRTTNNSGTIFIDPNKPDLRLAGQSPAIDGGRSTDAPDEDFEGNPRPSGGAVDIGAYEYVQTGIEPGATGESEELSVRGHPNPFNSWIEFTYSLPAAASVDLVVHDLTGRRIVHLFSGRKSAGMHRISWNGCDQYGQSAASGLYFCVIRTRESSKSVKVMLIR